MEFCAAYALLSPAFEGEQVPEKPHMSLSGPRNRASVQGGKTSSPENSEQTSQKIRLLTTLSLRDKSFEYIQWPSITVTLKGTGRENIEDFVHDSGQSAPWKPGVGKRLILISAGIICIGIIARIGYNLLGEATPTTDKAVVEGDTYPVSSRIDGTIGGIFVSNRQYVKAGDLLAEIDKRDLEAKLAAARTDLVQAEKMLPEIETQLSKAQAELETAQSKMFRRDRQLIEATSDYQYISKIRAKKGVSPLLLSRAQKEYESALSDSLRAKVTLVSASDRVREIQALRDTNYLKMHTAETTVQQTETQLSLTKIYAPANGHVVFDKTNFA